MTQYVFTDLAELEKAPNQQYLFRGRGVLLNLDFRFRILRPVAGGPPLVTRKFH